ncbi:LuxR C-terminal-related transcriptional regulator [Paraburkholderia sp. MM5384-R2]|uniref:LuxR C-terminal-related transcriptional regulator n=1 Tax=Paraburkholderia sp. MM5384-R2 TaxID=2723097 RepID=UPI00161B12E9|nr:LuxR C-terminal-related transcriptional regulator [Paraburkholderia sp. MM5384-R2]MBB5498721.1 LuxR family maltose regulon positive regulatory protein [Paraburkholderia sp. MM5384-R2]
MQLPEITGLSTIDTKLLPPTQKRELLKRERLMREFSQHRLCRLVLITAPAGYGKTSLLGQVIESLAVQRYPVAWISIDQDDNDLMRFFAHLWKAVSAALGERNTFQSLVALQGVSAGYLPPAATLKAELLNLLASLKQDLYLFFDDFHLIEHPDVLELTSAILLASLNRLHVIVAARHIPKLPIPRLRALGELHEITTDDLAFSSEETTALIDAAGGICVSPDQVKRLHEKTEGWVVSLQLAAFAIQSTGDTEAFIREFTGAGRDVGDFLMEEVVKSLPDDMHEFLIATSILDRFTAELADAVLLRKDSRSRIDRLESQNMFLFSLDRERIWYRYHHLFSELLRKRLPDSSCDAVMPEYHRRACTWLESRGHITDAIRHAFACGDLDRAGDLLDTASTTLFAAGQASTLHSLASRLPAAILNRLPRLQLELAWTNEIQWRFEEAREEISNVRSQLTRDLQRSDEAEVRPAPPEAAVNLHAKLEHRNIMLKVFTDDLNDIETAGTAWNTTFGRRDHFMSASIATAMMLARREHYVCDLTQAESDDIRRELAEGRAVYGNVFLDTVVGGTYFMRGELGLAEKSLRQAHELASRLHGEHSLLSAMPSTQLAQILYEKGELEEARTLIDECADLSPVFGIPDSVIARQLTTARLAMSDGNDQAAHAALDAATLIADRYKMPRLHAHVLAERVRLLIAARQLREAELFASNQRYAKGLQDVSPSGHVDTTKEQFAIATARIEGEKGNLPQAIALVRRWVSWTRDRRCLRSAIRLSILLAKLQYRSGEVSAGRRSMLDALEWGSRSPFVQSFLDEGPIVAKIIEEIAAAAAPVAPATFEYFRRLQHAFGRDSSPDQIVLDATAQTLEQSAFLSDRERQILDLTSKNYGNDEIALALGLAQSTIKWYWRRIFEKLGVHRKTAAVRLAKQQGIIP